MKKIIILFICFGIVSLACLSTSSAAQLNDVVPGTTLTTLTNASPTADQALIPTLTNSRQDSMCAVVIADEALHVRELANADSIVLTWLNNGDVVEVLNPVNGEWWKVRFSDVVGFANSRYLKESECVK